MHHLARTLYQWIKIAIVFFINFRIEIALIILFSFALIFLFKSYFPSDKMYVFLSKSKLAYFLGSNSACVKKLLLSIWTLWKSYIFSCLTKEEKRLWRKYLGRIIYYSFFWFRIRMPRCSVSQQIIFAYYFDWIQAELLSGCCIVFQ